MSKLLHVVICFWAVLLINPIKCIKLTKENVISLVVENDDLSKKNISEIDPFALEVLNSTHLGLNDNELTYLQEDLFKYNTKFEHLSFWTNKISKIHPLVFQELQNLTTIDLGDNELTELHENLFARNTKLMEISLYENRIAFIHPNAFKNLKNLEKLSVYSNQLTIFDLNLLSSCEELQSLYLNNNDLTEIRYQDFKLRFPKLSEVSFTENKFNCSFAKQIDDYLKDEHINHSYGPILCISDEAYAAIVNERNINTLVLASSQLSVRLTNMQLNLDEKLNKITVELINYANDRVIIENAEMKRVINDLKLQLLEQQSVIDELQLVTKSCCDRT